MKIIRVSLIAIAILTGMTVAAAHASTYSEQEAAKFYVRHDIAGTMKYLQEWMRAKPSDPLPHLLLGETYLALHDTPRGLSALHDATRISPSFGRAWLVLGNVYMGLKEYSKAVEAYGHAKSSMPTNPLVWTNYSAALSYAGDNKGSVQALYDGMRVSAANLNSADWYNFANGLARMNQTRQSIPVYEKSIQADPKNAEAWNNLGVEQEEVGMYKEALQSYQRAAALNDSIGKKNLARLNGVFQAYHAQLRAGARNSQSAYQRSMRQLAHDTLFYGHPVLAGDRP